MIDINDGTNDSIEGMKPKPSTLAEELYSLRNEVEETASLVFGPQPTETISEPAKALTDKIDFFITAVQIMRSNLRRINEALEKMGLPGESPKEVK